MIQHVLDLKTQIAEQTEALTVANEKRSTIAEECVRIEKEIKEFSSNRDAKIKSLQVTRKCRSTRGLTFITETNH